MTAQEFCYWLQGFFELSSAGGAGHLPLTAMQTECIRQHLCLVFQRDDPRTPEYQAWDAAQQGSGSGCGIAPKGWVGCEVTYK
jgi:hypothetical protein